jgi:autotransporter-associated beta strand protein
MGPIILNGGTLLSTTTTGVQYDSFELSAITSGGTSPSLMSSLNPGDPTGGACLTINAAAGAQLPFTVAPTGSGGADLTVNIILVNSGGSQNATGFVLNGGGVLALNDSNIFTGPVTLSNGVARLNAAEIAGTSGPLGNGGTISNFGGTLQFSVTNQFDYSSRFSTAAGQTYKIDTAGQSVTFATALSSSGAGLTKLGAGALNLTAPNTYTGATTVSNGTLVVASTGSIGSTSAISVSGGGTLDVSSQSVFTVPGGVTLTGSGGASPAVIRAQALNVNGPITLNYSAGQSALNVVGTLTLSHNAFTVNAASQLGAGTYTLISQQSGNIVSTGPYTVTGTAVGAIGTTASIVVNGGAVQLVIVSVPANITFTYNSSLTSLSISWPPAFLGSTLLYQSNSTSVGLLTAPGSWLVYPGSTNVTNITIPIARTNEAFFELRHP